MGLKSACRFACVHVLSEGPRLVAVEELFAHCQAPPKVGRKIEAATLQNLEGIIRDPMPSWWRAEM